MGAVSVEIYNISLTKTIICDIIIVIDINIVLLYGSALLNIIYIVLFARCFQCK